MKGNISLKEFITEVKEELKSAIDNDDPFFVLGDVELEVTFGLDATAKAGMKLVVFDLGGETTATQTHKVKLTLSPFVEQNPIQTTPFERPNTGVNLPMPLSSPTVGRYSSSDRHRPTCIREPDFNRLGIPGSFSPVTGWITGHAESEGMKSFADSEKKVSRKKAGKKKVSKKKVSRKKVSRKKVSRKKP